MKNIVLNDCHYEVIENYKNVFNLEKNRDYYFSKYPFAEYLSVSGRDRDIYKKIAEDMHAFPLNWVYSVFLIFRKIKNRLIKLSKGLRK